MNPKNRQQLLTILAIVAAGLWAGNKLVLDPLTASWKTRAGRIAELRNSITQGSKLMDRDHSIHSHWEMMRTNTLPGAASLAEAQVYRTLFERWSRDSQISISSIRPQRKPSNDDYMTCEFRIDAFGNMQALTRFLYSVEKDPMALKVDSVEIAARDNDGQQLTLGLQISGLVLNPTEQ